jgi:hypothetical protein
MPSQRSNPLAHGYKTKHVVWHRSEGNGGKGTAKSIAAYVLREAKEYSMVVDVAGGCVQLYPITTGARSLENGGVDGGVGCNRDAAICFQICLTGFTKDKGDIDKFLATDTGKKLMAWLDDWGIPRVDVSDPHRGMGKWRTDGHTTHASAPHNSHTDGVPLGWLKSGGGKPDDDVQRFVVLVKAKDGKWKPVGKDPKTGKIGVVSNADNWAHEDKPGIRPPRHGVPEMTTWAKAHGKRYKVIKVEKFSKTVGGNGDLRLKAGAAWPTDKRTVERLKAVAADLGKPLIIISGKRTIRGYAADTDIINSDGSLTSIGLNAEARKLLAKHGLVLQVASEAWHVAPKEIASWAYWQKP